MIDVVHLINQGSQFDFTCITHDMLKRFYQWVEEIGYLSSTITNENLKECVINSYGIILEISDLENNLSGSIYSEKNQIEDDIKRLGEAVTESFIESLRYTMVVKDNLNYLIEARPTTEEIDSDLYIPINYLIDVYEFARTAAFKDLEMTANEILSKIDQPRDKIKINFLKIDTMLARLNGQYDIIDEEFEYKYTLKLEEYFIKDTKLIDFFNYELTELNKYILQIIENLYKMNSHKVYPTEKPQMEAETLKFLKLTDEKLNILNEIAIYHMNSRVNISTLVKNRYGEDHIKYKIMKEFAGIYKQYKEKPSISSYIIIVDKEIYNYLQIQ